MTNNPTTPEDKPTNQQTHTPPGFNNLLSSSTVYNCSYFEINHTGCISSWNVRFSRPSICPRQDDKDDQAPAKTRWQRSPDGRAASRHACSSLYSFPKLSTSQYIQVSTGYEKPITFFCARSHDAPSHARPSPLRPFHAIQTIVPPGRKSHPGASNNRKRIAIQ